MVMMHDDICIYVFSINSYHFLSGITSVCGCEEVHKLLGRRFLAAH